MLQKLAYAVALLWGAVPVSAAIFLFTVGEPGTRLTGLPMAIVFSLFAWLMWALVRRGYAIQVILSPFVIGGLIAWHVLSD